MNPVKYIITVPNHRLTPGCSHGYLTMLCSSLRECRRIWKGSKGKRIYRLVERAKKGGAS